MSRFSGHLSLLLALGTLGARAQMTITSDVGTTICKGTTVVMTADGYQEWQVSTDGGGSWTSLGYANEPYAYASSSIGNGHMYRTRAEEYDFFTDNFVVSYSNVLTFTVTGESVGPNTITDPSRGSVSFDGTSQGLRMSSGFSVGTGAFTFETWFRMNDAPWDNKYFVLLGPDPSDAVNNRAVHILIPDPNTIRYDSWRYAPVNFTVPKLSANTWYHLVMVRDASRNLTVFLNGTRSATGIFNNSSTDPTMTNNSGLTRFVGVNPQGMRFNGDLSNVRMVVGSAVYDPSQTTLTVPTSPLSSVTNTQLLLLASSSGTVATDASGTQTLTGSSSMPGFAASSPFRETVSGARTISNAVAGGSWSSSNTSVATVDAATGVITPVADGHADITYSITSGGCTSTAVTPIAVSLPCTTNSWSGGTGNWNVAGHWSCGSVPDGSTDIAVTTGTPTLDVDFTLPSGRSLTLSGSGSLVVAPGKTLTIAGTADFGGRPVTLQSTASGDAAIGQVTGNLSNASQVTVERYIATAKRAWRLLGIPVTGSRTLRDQWAGVAANASAPAGETAGSGTLLTGHQYANGSSAAAAGFDWYTGMTATSTSSIRFYSHNGTSGSFSSATNTPNVAGTPAKQGYMLFVRGDRTVTSGSGTTTLMPSGTLLTGTRNVSITQAYEVVGNPYAATLDLDQVYLNSGNSNVVQRNFWVWDATLGTAGGFRAISYGTSSYTMSGGSGTATDYLKIRSGNAFFVQKNGGGGNLSIEENDKVDGSSAPVVLGIPEAGEPQGLLSITLHGKDGKTLDGVAARFASAYAPSPLETFDMPKLNNFTENLSLVRTGRYLAIESRPWPTGTDTLFLTAWNLSQGQHTISLSAEGIPHTSLSARLIDRYTGLSTPIDLRGAKTDIAFPVTSDSGSRSPTRLLIVFRSSSAVDGPSTGEPALSLIPNPSANGRIGLRLSNLPAGRYEVTVRTATGALVARQRIQAPAGSSRLDVVIDKDVETLRSGPFLITLDDGKGLRRTLTGWYRH